MIAIIPARFGSEGVKDKNWRDFCGKSLVERAIDFAHDNLCSTVVVTTNKTACLDVGTIYSGTIYSEIHDTEARAVDVWRDALRQSGTPEEFTCYLEPSSPFRDLSDYNRCLFALMGGWYQCAATVSSAQPPQKLLQMGIEDGHKVPVGDLTNKPRQGMGRWYRRNGAVYMASVEHVLSGKMMEERCCPVVSFGPRPNIDTEEDWLMAELLWRHLHG